MSALDDDDDYLSDKFLINASANTTTKPTTYSQIRKEAQKKAQQKNEQNRHKSRRQLELESREEGLSKSLFERAKEEEDSGLAGSSNKALSIMMKMGFKPGQSLGTVGHDQQGAGEPIPATTQVPPSIGENPEDASPAHPTVAHAKHKTEPLPIHEWAGTLFFCCGHSGSPNIIPKVERVLAWANEPVHLVLPNAWQRWQKWPKTWVIATSETEPETIIIIGEPKED